MRTAEELKLRAAFKRMTPRCREVVTLTIVQGLKNTEAAAKLGISAPRVKQHVDKAMRMILYRLRAEEQLQMEFGNDCKGKA